MRAALWAGLAAALGACSILELPFKLLGFVLQGLFQLFQALINVGSSAAMQVAKLAPIAMLFTQAAPGTSLEAGKPEASIGHLAVALESAPPEIVSANEAREMIASKQGVLLVDPASLLSEEGRRKIAQALEGREILAVRWIPAESAITSALPPSPAICAR